MKLTPEQQAMLNGEKGETMAKVVKTLVMYGDAFGAERMVPVTSKYGHTVISFGLKAIKPVYELYDQLIDAGLTSAQKFTADPRPIDDNIPTSLLEDIVFKKIMYTHQASYEEQLKKLGIKGEDDYTCTCYMDEVGNKPAKGEVLSWGGILRSRVRKLRPRRALQPQLRNYRAHGLRRGLCPRVRPADR